MLTLHRPSSRPLWSGCLLAIALLSSARSCRAAEAPVRQLAGKLRELDTRVIVVGTVRQPPLESMLARDVQARLRMANRAETQAWDQVRTKAEWERFREVRLQALRTSLGEFPAVPKDMKVQITATREGDGYRVDNLVFESRPGLVVTANLYRPAKPPASMPGIVICHSHQQPKHTGARQDMAMTWARAGCLVLVPDHLGHGERRQHSFAESSPHDYHFRYDIGIQLHLAGESLMGWLAWDLMRGVDVLLKQPGIDAKRILLISEPAGGGDVAAVTGALDPRITGVMVNNFGGPQPETAYPLAKDAEQSYDYAGSGSWESTRNLRLSARDGFLPWVIDAAIAPRHLIYYHEFYWDKELDPVWKRLEKVYAFHQTSDALTGLAGRGFVVGSPPENTHWLAISRELLYPVLENRFGIANPKKEYSKPRPVEELLCLTPEASKAFTPSPLHELASALGSERTATARKERVRLSSEDQRKRLRQQWTRLLGDVAPQANPVVKGLPWEAQALGTVQVERIHLGTEPGIVVPLVLLVPKGEGKRVPVVVALAQEGKQELLHRRTELIAELLEAGIAVCLPDLRGTGETRPGEARDRRSAATSIAASEWMLGQSLLGGRLRDLRSVLRYLRQRPELDATRLALWGDSLAPVNPGDSKLNVPYTAANRPSQSEPLGGLLALLGALFEDEVDAVYLHGGLSDYHSVLEKPYCYLPHDAVVPGVLTVGDLGDVAAALSPRPLWLEGLVDGLNRAVSTDALQQRYEPALSAYKEAKAQERLRLGVKPDNSAAVARWLSSHLR